MENIGLIIEKASNDILGDIRTTYVNITDNIGAEALRDSYYWLEDIVNSDFRILYVDNINFIIGSQKNKIVVGPSIVEEAIKDIIKEKYPLCSLKVAYALAESFRILLDKEYELFFDVSKYILSIKDEDTLLEVGLEYKDFKDKYDCLVSYENFIIANLTSLYQVDKFEDTIEEMNCEFLRVYNSILTKGILTKTLNKEANKQISHVSEKKLLKRK